MRQTLPWLALSLLTLSACPSASPTPPKAQPPTKSAEAPAAAKKPAPAPVRANVRARTTAELERLRGVTTLAGSLHLLGAELTDLQALAKLETLEGSLLITNTGLKTLAGLGALRHVHGPIIIQSNTKLTSLQGLEALRTMATLRLENNPTLTSLAALSGLKDTGFSIAIERNDALPDLQGLSKVRALPGTLSIQHNASLENLGALSRLTSVGALHVEGNLKLQDLSGLSSLTRVRDRLLVRDVPACDLKNLSSRLTQKPDERLTQLDARQDGKATECSDWPAPKKSLRKLPRPPRHIARLQKQAKPYPKRWIAEGLWREGIASACVGLAYKKECTSVRRGHIRYVLHLDAHGVVRKVQTLENTVDKDPELVRECIEKAYKDARFAPARGHRSSFEQITKLRNKC